MDQHTSRINDRSCGFRGPICPFGPLGPLALSYGTFLVLNLLRPAVPPVCLQGCAIVPAVLFNYVINSAWTFRSYSKESQSRYKDGNEA